MFIINNIFNVGEEAYTVYRSPVEYECPICKGKGSFIHNGYEVSCRNCNGTGELHDSHFALLAPEKVKISSIKVSYNGSIVTVKYRVSSEHCRNRSESTMFKTIEEAEKYCKGVNTKEIASEF